MNKKYEAFFILYALGDTIGFNNGKWEEKLLRHYKYDHINEYVSNFISLGGVNGIELKKWLVSDDTEYLIATSNALIINKENKNIDKYVNILKNEIIKIHNKLVLEERKGIDRMPDETTVIYTEIFTDDDDARNVKLNDLTDYNMFAASRSMSIGLACKKDIQKLIDFSVESARITHNSIIGYLSSIITSYFVSLGIQNISVTEWPLLLIKLFESKMVKKYVGDDIDKLSDYILLINMWKLYIDTKLKNKKSKSFGNLIFRMKYYYDTFIDSKLIKDNQTEYLKKQYILQLIIVYDSLLDCDGCWEKLLFYSIFVYLYNPKSTMGAIAGGLYGAVYGFGDVPDKIIKHLEEKKTLLKLAKNFSSFF